MDTSLSICHRFDVEIPHGNFVEMTDFERRIHVEIMASTRSRNFDGDSIFKIDETSVSSTHGSFDVVLTSNQRNFCTCCFYCILSFSALGTYSKLFWYSAELMWFQKYWHYHWYWNYWNYILWEFLQQRK